MPLYALKCLDCGHEWAGLTTIADGDADACPMCKGRPERMVTGAAIGENIKDKEPGDFTKEELWLLRHNTREIEKEAANILSGATTAETGRGPKFLIPQVPEHLKKRYY